MSNPLLMNDLEEVRFGIMNGYDVIMTSRLLSEALGGDGAINAFQTSFHTMYEQTRKVFQTVAS